MKKVLAMTMALAMAVVATGCSGSSSSSTSTTAAATTAAAEAVTWPTDDITIYVPNAAGSSNDLCARVFATYIQGATGHVVTVMNNADGGGIAAYEEVRNAKPDGTTLLWQHTGIDASYWTGNYDHRPDEVFTVLGSISRPGLQAYCAQADAPFNNLDELFEYAKANPETVRYGVKLGNSTHITACRIENAAGVKFRMIDAADQSARLSALLGNNLDLGSMDILTAEQYVEEGDLKIIFTTLPYEDYQNAEEYEDGLLDFMTSGGSLIWGPAGMDASLVEAINNTMYAAYEDATVTEQMEALGQVMSYMDSAEATKLVEEDMVGVDEAATAAGINARH